LVDHAVDQVLQKVGVNLDRIEQLELPDILGHRKDRLAKLAA